MIAIYIINKSWNHTRYIQLFFTLYPLFSCKCYSSNFVRCCIISLSAKKNQRRRNGSHSKAST